MTGRGRRQSSASPSQFCCKHKTFLNNKAFQKNAQPYKYNTVKIAISSFYEHFKTKTLSPRNILYLTLPQHGGKNLHSIYIICIDHVSQDSLKSSILERNERKLWF